MSTQDESGGFDFGGFFSGLAEDAIQAYQTEQQIDLLEAQQDYIALTQADPQPVVQAVEAEQPAIVTGKSGMDTQKALMIGGGLVASIVVVSLLVKAFD